MPNQHADHTTHGPASKRAPEPRTAGRGVAERELVDGLLAAYQAGVFPMGGERGPLGEPGPIMWYDPDPRAIIPLNGLRVPRTLRQRVRSGRFRITSDTAFERVLAACAASRPGREETWIDARIASAYAALHRAGHAHTVEAWLDTDDGPFLVGGLYGVSVGGLFAGESMFSVPEHGGTDASKVCLVHLVAHLRRRGFALLDTQFITTHLARLGAIEIPRTEYRVRLKRALTIDAVWTPFEAHRNDGD